MTDLKKSIDKIKKSIEKERVKLKLMGELYGTSSLTEEGMIKYVFELIEENEKLNKLVQLFSDIYDSQEKKINDLKLKNKKSNKGK